MKIQYISDLHLDFWIKTNNSQHPKFQKQLDEYCEIIGLKESDVIIIAGDLGHYYQQDTAFLLKCKEYAKHVIVVYGNHDFYLISNAQQKKYLRDSWNRVFEMKSFCRENGIHYLDGDMVSFDGVTFGGAGMSWDKSFINELYGEEQSDYSVKQMFENTMNDSRLIFARGQDNYMTPTAYGGKHLSSGFDPFEHFEIQKEKLSKIDSSVDVMVSHYAPIVPPLDQMPVRYHDDPVNTFYYFDGKEDVERINPKYWIFGHTHSQYDFMYENTNLLCNPLGYPGENTYATVKEFEI